MASIVKTLTIERSTFSHEKEVRLIYQSDSPQGDSVLKCTVDLHIMVDQVMMHPQLRQDEVDGLKGRIRKYLSYKGCVKRSLLYALPTGFSLKIPYDVVF